MENNRFNSKGIRMRQSNLFEYLEELEDAIRQELFKETASEDTTETLLNEDEYVPEEPKESDVPNISLIEQVITTFLNKCIEAKRLPTQQEAQTMYILDEINSKYHG